MKSGISSMPSNGDMSIGEINDMIREVNATTVSSEDVLSDDAYRYDFENRTLCAA